MLKKIIFLGLIGVNLVACAATQNNSSSNNIKQTQASEQNKQSAQNKYPEEKQASPIDQVYQTLEDFHDYKSINLSQILSYANNTHEATVTLIQSGFSDDSIQGTRKEFKFRYIDGVWKQLSVDESVQCWRGQDTTSFHKGLCL